MKDLIKMSKIFISGSRTINDYELVESSLLNIIAKEDTVLVGDCYGVDSLVQKFCHLNSISFIVYYVGSKPRNVIGFNPSLNKCFGFNQKAKDIQMTIDCDSGIAFWNGKSKGTENNIQRLKEMGKHCEVIKL